MCDGIHFYLCKCVKIFVHIFILIKLFLTHTSTQYEHLKRCKKYNDFNLLCTCASCKLQKLINCKLNYKMFMQKSLKERSLHVSTMRHLTKVLRSPTNAFLETLLKFLLTNFKKSFTCLTTTVFRLNFLNLFFI